MSWERGEGHRQLPTLTRGSLTQSGCNWTSVDGLRCTISTKEPMMASVNLALGSSGTQASGCACGGLSYVNWCGKWHLNCGWNHFLEQKILGHIKWEKGHQCKPGHLISLLSDGACVWYNQLLQAPAGLALPPAWTVPWTVNQNKPFSLKMLLSGFCYSSR